MQPKRHKPAIILLNVARGLVVFPFMVRTVSGHSMLPVLPPNTTIVGVRRFRSLKPGDVVIFLHDGKEKVKRIREIRGSEVFLLGDHGDASTDSRHFGWIYASSITAKVIYPRNLTPIPDNNLSQK